MTVFASVCTVPWELHDCAHTDTYTDQTQSLCFFSLCVWVGVHWCKDKATFQQNDLIQSLFFKKIFLCYTSKIMALTMKIAIVDGNMWLLLLCCILLLDCIYKNIVLFACICRNIVLFECICRNIVLLDCIYRNIVLLDCICRNIVWLDCIWEILCSLIAFVAILFSLLARSRPDPDVRQGDKMKKKWLFFSLWNCDQDPKSIFISIFSGTSCITQGLQRLLSCISSQM